MPPYFKVIGFINPAMAAISLQITIHRLIGLITSNKGPFFLVPTIRNM